MGGLSLVLLVLIIPFAGAGVLAFLFFRGGGGAASRWPAAPGTMLATRVDDPAPGAFGFTPLVHYRYQVGPQQFDGVQLRQGPVRAPTREAAYAMVARYPPGAPVQVRYNPHNPQESVLEAGGGGRNPLLLIGAVVLLIGGLVPIGLQIADEAGLFDNDSSTSSYSNTGSVGNGSYGTTDMNVMSTPPMGSTPPSTAPSVNNHSLDLVGRWTRTGDCSRGMQLFTGGSMIAATGQSGTWSLNPVSANQSLITLAVGGISQRAWIDRMGEGHYRLTPMDSGEAQFDIRRCSAGSPGM